MSHLFGCKHRLSIASNGDQSFALGGFVTIGLISSIRIEKSLNGNSLRVVWYFGTLLTNACLRSIDYLHNERKYFVVTWIEIKIQWDKLVHATVKTSWKFRQANNFSSLLWPPARRWWMSSKAFVHCPVKAREDWARAKYAGHVGARKLAKL